MVSIVWFKKGSRSVFFLTESSLCLLLFFKFVPNLLICFSFHFFVASWANLMSWKFALSLFLEYETAQSCRHKVLVLTVKNETIQSGIILTTMNWLVKYSFTLLVLWMYSWCTHTFEPFPPLPPSWANPPTVLWFISPRSPRRCQPMTFEFSGCWQMHGYYIYNKYLVNKGTTFSLYLNSFTNNNIVNKTKCDYWFN